MVSSRFLIFLCSCFIILIGISCNEGGKQAGRAASQNPRYEFIPRLAIDSQIYYFTEFEGNQPRSTDSLKYSLRSLGNGQYVQYELYNEYLNQSGRLELDVLESVIDTDDTIQSQKVRDQRFVLYGDSLSLYRFETQKKSLDQSYQIAVGDTTYSVYNLLGYAHQADYTPTHRVFFTQRYGSFFMWFGDWNTIELTRTKFPDGAEDLLALRAKVRELVSIPFPPVAPSP